MKHVHEWQDPWKKKEPGGRLSKKALKDQLVMEKQAEEMKRAATQQVTIICQKNLFLDGLFNAFLVKVKIPLREEEFLERMKLGFPELVREDS